MKHEGETDSTYALRTACAYVREGGFSLTRFVAELILSGWQPADCDWAVCDGGEQGGIKGGYSLTRCGRN